MNVEENAAFKTAFEKVCTARQSRQNMTDFLEGLSEGWLAARAYFSAALAQLRREGVEAMLSKSLYSPALSATEETINDRLRNTAYRLVAAAPEAAGDGCRDGFVDRLNCTYGMETQKKQRQKQAESLFAEAKELSRLAQFGGSGHSRTQKEAARLRRQVRRLLFEPTGEMSRE